MDARSCVGCGGPFSSKNKEAVVCVTCQTRGDPTFDDRRRARNIARVAYASLVAGLVAVGWNPLFAPMVIAFGSGIYAMQLLLPGNQGITKHLSDDAQKVAWVCAGFGILGAGVRILIELSEHHFFVRSMP